MKEEPDAYIDFDQPVAGRPKRPQRSTDARRLDPTPSEMIPCPGDKPGECDSSTLLNKEYAGYVADYLEKVDRRTSGQENNLGCALVWVGEHKAARRAFERAENKADTDQERHRAQTNIALLDGEAPK